MEMPVNFLTHLHHSFLDDFLSEQYFFNIFFQGSWFISWLILDCEELS
jgi:hypothetical protein